MREALNRVLTWTALILPWGMLVAYLHIFWSYSPQYEYGWLVLPLGLRLFLLRWNAQGDYRRGHGIGASGATALFAFLIAPIWFIRQATTHWSIPGYGLTALIIAYTFAVLGIMGGWRLARQMAIPILFVFCAVKLPLSQEQWLIQSLSRFAAGASVEVLHLFGIPAVHSGNLVILNKGVIGISEACSGIHSLQSLFMVAIFLGEERRMLISLRCFMVGLGVALSLTFNVLRILILSLICLRSGMTDFEQWHDRAGWSILLLSLGIMIFVANELGGKVRSHGNGPPPSLRPMPLWMAATATVWFLATIVGSETWYRIHDTREADARRVEVLWPRRNPTFAPVEIPNRVRDITLCSNGQGGRWQEGDGTDWTVSMLQFGGGPKGTSQWAPMHTPDICFPASGMPLERTYPPAKLKLPGGDMVFQSWEFKRRNHPVFVFYCRHDEGRAEQGDAFLQDAFGVVRALQGQRNLGQQTIEFALAGYDTQENALKALRQRLPALLELRKLKGNGGAPSARSNQ
ncbi:MAG: exosortase/archaeosortase family protein [Chthoniobacteraceae bacterium]|nr:exosortase/archaeosortase family protein [Chthoniobacteraceae bacterium]